MAIWKQSSKPGCGLLFHSVWRTYEFYASYRYIIDITLYVWIFGSYISNICIGVQLSYFPSTETGACFKPGHTFCVLFLLFVFRVCLSHCLVCSLQPCGHLLGRADLLVLLYMMLSCVFVIFPYGVLGQVWYLMVLIPDIFLVTHFKTIIKIGQAWELLSAIAKLKHLQQSCRRETIVEFCFVGSCAEKM